jgi:hypothetical protein
MTTTEESRPGRHIPTPARWLRRPVISLVAGAAVWGLAELLGSAGGRLQRVVVGVLCAGAVLAGQYVHGLIRRLDERARRAESALAESADVVRESLALHDDVLRQGLVRHAEALRDALARHAEDVKDAVESHLESHLDRHADRPGRGPWPAGEQREASAGELLPQLTTSVPELLATGPVILQSFARLEVNRIAGHLTDLRNLSAECPGENHDWMLSLTWATEHSIFATSTSVDREFWSSEPAGRYLDAQQEAVDQRGVTVRRLFLLDSARSLDDHLLRLCEEQELRRIEVRVAVLPELPPNIQRGTTDDFIVYDEQISFEIEQDLRDVNVRTRLNARPHHVQERMKRFRELWEAGMNVRELEVRVDDEVDDEEEGPWRVVGV